MRALIVVPLMTNLDGGGKEPSINQAGTNSAKFVVWRFDFGLNY